MATSTGQWWRLPQEKKTPHMAPPREELDSPYDIELVFVQQITSVLRKINKKLPPTDLFFLTPRGSRRLCPVISFEQFKHWPRGTHGIFVVERCRYVLRFRGATAVPISRPCDREPNPPVTRPTRDVLRYRFAAKSKTGANK